MVHDNLLLVDLQKIIMIPRWVDYGKEAIHSG